MKYRSILISLTVVAFIAAIWAAVLGFERYDRSQSATNASLAAENLAIAFEESVHGILRGADWALGSLRDGFLSDLESGGSGIAGLTAAPLPPPAFQLGYIDARGILRYTNLVSHTPPVDLSDRDHFKVHLDPDVDQMFVSRPVFGRVSNVWSIQLSRKISAADGRFLGVLVLSVDRREFTEFFRRIDIGVQGLIALVGADRWLRALDSNVPPPNDPYATPLDDRPFFAADAPDAGPYGTVARYDGMHRIGAYRKVRTYPLVVTVLYSFDEVMDLQTTKWRLIENIGVGAALLVIAAGLTLDRLIDRRDQARRQAAEHDARWRLALESVGDGVWDWRPPTGVVTFSPGWLRLLGLERRDVEEHLSEWERRVHPDDLGYVLDALRSHLETRTPPYQCEYRMRSKDGRDLWVLDRGVVIERTADGRPLRMVGIISDISERKRLESELAIRDREMRNLHATMAAREIGIARHRLSEAQRVARLGTLERGDEPGAWRLCPHACSLLHVGYDEARSLDDVLVNVPDHDKDVVRAALAPFPATGVDVEFTVLIGTETRIVHAVGSSGANRAEDGEFITLQDVTARRTAERERALIQDRMEESARMESLGTLAGGIAHEINTPVQYVGDNLNFLRGGIVSLLGIAEASRLVTKGGAGLDLLTARIADVKLDFLANEMPAAADQALAGVDRISAIVRAVKDFCYPSAKVPQPFDLNYMVESVVTITRNSWKYAADLQVDLDPALPSITAIEGEINQVLVNLIINAAQAIVEKSEPRLGSIRVSTRLAGEHVVVTVDDDGVGIPHEIQKKIFELFFTTKPPGTGTGQGLAISSAIVRRHGGRLEVRSAPGAGASFSFTVPLTGQPGERTMGR